jgi:DNA repair protein RadC
MNIELTEDQKVKIRRDSDLFPIMKEILLRESTIDLNKEHFWCVGLANNSKLLYIELVSLGTLSQSIVEPMDIFAWALQKQVAMLILVHNHPSGDLMPTSADLELTDQMIQVGRIVHIPVVDHFVISTEGYYSFDREGDLKKLQKSKKYVPDFMQVEEIKKTAEKIGEKRGIEKGKKEGILEGAKGKALEMAKKMKQNGEPIKRIVEYTGLSKEEIEKL